MALGGQLVDVTTKATIAQRSTLEDDEGKGRWMLGYVRACVVSCRVWRRGEGRWMRGCVVVCDSCTPFLDVFR